MYNIITFVFLFFYTRVRKGHENKLRDVWSIESTACISVTDIVPFMGSDYQFTIVTTLTRSEELVASGGLDNSCSIFEIGNKVG